MAKFNDLLEKETHLACLNYVSNQQSLIEAKDMFAGDVLDRTESDPVIIFVIKGNIRVSCDTIKDTLVCKGKSFLLPSQSHWTINCLKECILIIFHVNEPILLCECLMFEALFKNANIRHTKKYTQLYVLNINRALKYYLAGLLIPLKHGVRCLYYLKSKIRELLLLMRIYYPRNLLISFFYPISENLFFKTSMQKHIQDMHTVKELAEMSNSSLSTFHRHFRRTMGTTPAQWKNEERAKLTYRELKTGDKPLKQISEELGFQSVSYFNKFCKTHTGKTPGQIRKESKNP